MCRNCRALKTRPNRRSFDGLLLIAVVSALLYAPVTAFAQDAATATTTDNPEIPIDELKILLKPLTKAELQTEADGWLALLQAKVSEISQRELAVKRANRKIAEATEAAAEEPDAESEAEVQEETKKDTLEELNILREQRTALCDRVNIVLDELASKGGDPKDARLYVKAVSGITPSVDVADVSGTWIAVRGWVTSKEGGLRWARNAALFVVTVLVFFIISRLAGSAVGKGMSLTKSKSGLLRDFMVKITRRTVFFVGFVVALSMLEVPIAPFLAVIGAAGLVIGLALQGTLSNFASGIMILLHRPFDVNDVINAAGISGTVESMSVLSTHIRTFDNQRMIVPNNAIWEGVITNVTGNPTRRVDMVFGISYTDDMAKAEKIMREILEGHELVLPDPAPNIRLHELGDSSVNFICRPWVKTPDYWTVYWDVTRSVKERFDAEGVSIPFPQRDVHLYQESASGA